MDEDDIAIRLEDLAPLTVEERAEIDRRLAEHARNPDTAIPWEQVHDFLKAKYG